MSSSQEVLKVISFYHSNYPDGESPMANRLHLYMRALQHEGAEVKIVSPTHESKEMKVIDGIKYEYLKIDNHNKLSSKSKKKAYLKAVRLLSRNCDVIFTSLSNDSDVVDYLNTIKKVNGKIVFEMNENPHSIIGSRTDFRWILKVKRWFFLNLVVRRVEGFIVISRSLEDLFNKYKGPNTIIVRIPILTDGKSKFNQKRFFAEEKFIFHAGSLHEQKDGIKSMLEAYLKFVRKYNIQLKFFFTQKKGLPNLIKWINKFSKKFNLESQIKFTGILSRSDLDSYYDRCSLAIINKPSNEQNEFNFSTKITELIPRGIPLIISNTGEHKYYFKHNYNCYLVDPNNVEQISEGIYKILNDIDYCQYITKNALDLANNEFFYLNHSKTLYEYFLKIKNGK